MQDDAMLVRQAIAGDEKAFHHLVREYYKSIYVQILSVVHNPADAEELTNDVFTKAYLNLPRLRQFSNFHNWLRQIARYHCRDWLRKHKEYCLSLEEISVEKEARLRWDSADSRLIQQEMIDRALEAIESLPKMDKALMQDFYLDDLSYKALQQRYHLSEAAVRMRLLRARQKVRERLRKLLSGVAALRWQNVAKTALLGGLEAMKLSIKTRLIAAGAAAFLGLGGAGVLIWQISDGKQDPTSDVIVQGIQGTDAASSAIGRSAEETANLSQKEIEEAIAFLGRWDKAEDLTSGIGISSVDENGKGEKASGKSEGQGSSKEELSPELKRKAEQYKKLAAILPALRKIREKTRQLCEENRTYAERSYRLRGTPNEIPQNEEEAFFTQSDREIRAKIAEEETYYARIDEMFPELELLEIYYIDINVEDGDDPRDARQVRFHGARLLEYFGKKLPWDGNTDYSQAEDWDGSPYWRPE